MCIDLSVGLIQVSLEIVGLRVRRDKSMKVSPSGSTIHCREAVRDSQGCATLQVIGHRSCPRLVDSAIVWRIQVRHELDGDCIMIDIYTCQMLATSGGHDSRDDSVRNCELAAIGNVRRE